ncbi:MAG: helix-turn-helix transcriptional regulator [Oscillatoriales cyanobacterium SM2_1_8]|nr:helix-turn-helix transcriptional regulator [Oscillatoriales cyanobacterium SM2_1_8]
MPTEVPISLSDRELQVIELVAAGLTNQEIANTLAISKRTVDNHISNILTKTRTENRVELFRWALRWGKVCIDQVNCCTLALPNLTALETAADGTRPQPA